MKIVYVIASLATSGGTERIISEKANYLANVFGYDVSIICYDQRNDSNNFYPVSKKVKQYNLGLLSYSIYKYKFFKRLWKKISLRIRLKRLLSLTVQEINPDILIGVSHFRADFVCSVNSNAKIIIESHIPRAFIESNKVSNYIVYLYKKLYDMNYYRYIEKRADTIVTLTEGDHKKWIKAKRIQTIPNFSNMQVHQLCDCSKKRVISIGRLCKEKGFDRLLDIWKTVISKHPDWQLDIYGEGEMKEELEHIIKSDNIANVALRGITNNIGKELSNSSICAATSYYEGFSLVLLEAIKYGVPCVSFDCPYGPKTIIEDNKCGYLVEDGNTSLFVKKLSTLMENEPLRQQFSIASRERSKAFNKDTIMLQWKNLFEEIGEKRLSFFKNIKIQLPNGFLDAEIRNGYLVTIEMKKVWAVELDLLCEFQRVADKYGLKYIANGGTMLGAIRHGGFIPWDDDIDLMMMRDEYDKLCEIASKEFHHPYFFQTEYSDPGSLRCHAQLRNSETTAILNNEKAGHFHFNQGIFIDIFPLDAVPDNEELFNTTSKTAMRYFNYMNHFASVSVHYRAEKICWKQLLKVFLHTIGNPVFSYLAHHYFKKYEGICKRFNGKRTQKISIYCWGYKYEKLHRSRADHEETIMMPFEFIEVPVCKNYDHALMEVFGDWHKFVIGGSIHGNCLFDTEKPYTDYI